MQQIFVNPVDLEPVTIDPSKDGIHDFSTGEKSNKNEMEIDHFLKNFKKKPADECSYTKRIKSLPKPDLNNDSVVLDIGCGPYDCISDLPGHKIYLDDIIQTYVERLSASFSGMCVDARTELMPFANNSIDLIYSVNMIDHVDDMPETVFELHRVLRNGGALYLQSYYNSHPLLETEPGVFDRHFIDNYISPYFEIETLSTFAVGDPAISSSYTQDIVSAVLVRKDVELPARKSRDRYKDKYVGPQSVISNAISTLKTGRNEDIKEILDQLEGEDCYKVHWSLLTAWDEIIDGDFGAANNRLKDMLTWERVRKNPYARIALMATEAKRLVHIISSKS